MVTSKALILSINKYKEENAIINILHEEFGYIPIGVTGLYGKKFKFSTQVDIGNLVELELRKSKDKYYLSGITTIQNFVELKKGPILFWFILQIEIIDNYFKKYNSIEDGSDIYQIVEFLKISENYPSKIGIITSKLISYFMANLGFNVTLNSYIDSNESISLDITNHYLLLNNSISFSKVSGDEISGIMLKIIKFLENNNVNDIINLNISVEDQKNLLRTYTRWFEQVFGVKLRSSDLIH